VGSLQSELGCPGDWQPDCAETELIATATPGVYAAEFTVPAGEYEYKVAVNDAWDESYGLNGGSDNIPLTVAGDTTVRVVFDDTLKRVGLEATGLRGAYEDASDAGLVADPVRQPGSDEQFYFVMTDRFQNGDAVERPGRPRGRPAHHRLRPDPQGLLQRRRPRRPAFAARLHRRTRHDGHLADAELQEPPGAGRGRRRERRLPRLLGHRLHPDRSRTSARTPSSRGSSRTRTTVASRSTSTSSRTTPPTSSTTRRASTRTSTRPPSRTATPTATRSTSATSPAPAPTRSRARPRDELPYTPTVTPDEADLKVPAWLNDPTLYHNRGDSTWEGESVTFGDFVGLDDLMTEHPTVVNGFVDVYDDWIDLGIDGFRIDTAKHVNFEFWEQWSTQVLDYAHANGKPDFFMFGEVYDADPQKLSPYVRKTDMNSVLDFTFQSQAVSFAAGNSAKNLQSLFAGDDYYTTPDSSATALPTFLGNHDMGRVGYFLQGTDAPLQRDELAHELLFLTRGQPVVYYGDEQGLRGHRRRPERSSDAVPDAGRGVPEPAARDGRRVRHGRALRHRRPALRPHHRAQRTAPGAPGARHGAQVERYVDNGAGVYAFSRVDRTEKVEYLVAANNSNAAKTVDIPTLTEDGAFEVLYGDGSSVTANADGVASVTVPALGTSC
jgi:glycosidase